MLRAVATWAVAAAVGAVGIAAAVGALRPKNPERPARPTSSRTSAPPLGPQLREAGVTGVLVYADERCRLHAVRLPALDLTEVPEAAGRPVRAPGGGPAAAGCTIPSPSEVSHLPTWIEGGRVQQLVPCSREALCRHVLLSRADLVRAASDPFTSGEERFVARELAWTQGIAWRSSSAAATPTSSLCSGAAPSCTAYSPASSPRCSTRARWGRYITVQEDGIQVVRVGKSPRNITFAQGLTSVGAVAWSPGEQWLAVATRASIWLMHLEEPGTPLIRLLIEARGVGWFAR